MKRVKGLAAISLLLLLIATALTSLLAQSAPVQFHRINTSDGLSQNSINAIFQDSYGYMWFATQDGLNRFDGYAFKVYRNDENDSNSLSENWIWAIYEDAGGLLWIGTFGGGANSFDRQRETFRAYRNDPYNELSLSDDVVWAFHEHSPQTLWIGANTGLNKLDRVTGRIERVYPDGRKANIFGMMPDQASYLWLTSADGLFRLDLESEDITAFNEYFREYGEELFIRVSITLEKPGVLWLGSSSNGLFRFDSHSGNLLRITHDESRPQQGLLDNRASRVHLDKTGRLWAGTREGLAILDIGFTKSPSGCGQYRHDPFDVRSLSHNFVSEIYGDRSGQIWIGTRSGLHRYDHYNPKFDFLRHRPDDPNSLSSRNTSQLIRARKSPEMLWVGTHDGYNLVDLQRQTTRRYFDSKDTRHDKLPSSYVLSLFEDENFLWVGTRGGGLVKVVNPYDDQPQLIRFANDPIDPALMARGRIHWIYEDRHEQFWLGTGGNGLLLFDRRKGRVERAFLPDGSAETLSDLFVFSTLEDQYDQFWVGTASGGVNLLDRETGRVRQFKHDPNDPQSLSSNRVLCLYESQDGRLLVGTTAGICQLDIKNFRETGKASFKNYRQDAGLPNDVIYAILEDDSGGFWISTNAGLAHLREDGNRVKVRTYTTADGLRSNEFTQNGYVKMNDGRLGFSNAEGINFFYPDSIHDNPVIPPIVVTDFRILNESVSIFDYAADQQAAGQGSGIVTEKPLLLPAGIELSYQQNVFSFEFAALNYTMPEMNQYAYKMEGFDEDWIYCGNRRFVTYTNLDAGNYRFRVKGSNNDGLWNEEGTGIDIRITPPPWKSWWAYLTYILFALSLIGAYVRFKIKQNEKELQKLADIERAKVEERERVRKKSSADFHDEAGNILTKLTLFTELAKRSYEDPQDLLSYLESIESNTKALSSGMRDFIWGLDPEKDTLYDTLIRLKDFGVSMFEHSESIFKVSRIEESLKNVQLNLDDRRAILLIFKEAMNNCLKYADATEVGFTCDLQDGLLRIDLVDNGKGFAEGERKGSGYGMKNMQARAESIGGQLEISSRPGRGTSILFGKRLDV